MDEMHENDSDERNAFIATLWIAFGHSLFGERNMCVNCLARTENAIRNFWRARTTHTPMVLAKGFFFARVQFNPTSQATTMWTIRQYKLHNPHEVLDSNEAQMQTNSRRESTKWEDEKVSNEEVHSSISGSSGSSRKAGKKCQTQTKRKYFQYPI